MDNWRHDAISVLFTIQSSVTTLTPNKQKHGPQIIFNTGFQFDSLEQLTLEIRWSFSTFFLLNVLGHPFQDRHYMAPWKEYPLITLATQLRQWVLSSESGFLCKEREADNSAVCDTKIHWDLCLFLQLCLTSGTSGKSPDLCKAQVPHLWKCLKEGCATDVLTWWEIRWRVHVLPLQLLHRSKIIPKSNSLIKIGQKGNCLEEAWRAT